MSSAAGAGFAVVFRGSKSLCREFSLVLEARGIEHETLESDSTWTLNVPVALLDRAYDEISRYSAERSVPRSVRSAMPSRPGAAFGVSVYVLVLLLAAYSAGNGSFGADWFAAGSLDAGSRAQWWRAITALTLHVDQEHWLGNVLFGALAGMGVGRLLGPGIAWASILGAAALANYCEMLIAPVDHRAVGASTAVFAALGLLTGLAWRQRFTLREGLWYRWAPLIAGICLLTLLGAGGVHVDVVGHCLGFIMGTGQGWLYAKVNLPHLGGSRVQILAGTCAVLLVLLAWLLALSSAWNFSL